jgi:hypothetical protein
MYGKSCRISWYINGINNTYVTIRTVIKAFKLFEEIALFQVSRQTKYQRLGKESKKRGMK